MGGHAKGQKDDIDYYDKGELLKGLYPSGAMEKAMKVLEVCQP